jgi:hypothetical protein
MEAKISGDLKSTMARTRHRSEKTLLGYMRDAGRGLPRSTTPDIEPPELAVGVSRRELVRARVEEVVDVDPLGIEQRTIVNVAKLTEADLRAIQREDAARQRDKRNLQRQAYLGRDVANLETCWRQWDAMGRPAGQNPPRLNEAMKRAYDRGYNAKLRGFHAETLTDEQRAECKKSGMRARMGTLSIWQRYKLKRLAE